MKSASFEKGFSLIESLLVVIMIGFIALLINNLPSSLGLVGGSKHQSIAKEITQKTIEDLRSQGYDNLANGTSSISDDRLFSLPQGSGQLLIEDCPINICLNNESTKIIKVTVSWTDSGKPKQAQLVTFISKGGLQ